MPPESAAVERLHGELAVLRSYQSFNAADGHGVVTLAQHALERLPEESLYASGGAVTMLGVGYQMTGEFTTAQRVVYQTVQDEAFQNTSSHARLLSALCFLHWFEADLTGFRQVATQYLRLSQDLKLPESLAIARYFLGIFHYQRNDLAAAEKFLIEAVNTSALLGAPLLICHDNDYGWWEIEEKLAMARDLGMNMWAEYYPYAAGSSAIGAEAFRPESLEDILGLAYKDVMYDPSEDKYLSKEEYLKIAKEDPGRTVVVFNPARKEWMQSWLKMPHMTVGSDAMWSTDSSLNWETVIRRNSAGTRVHPVHAPSYCAWRERQTFP